jgi:hypothetical protein
VADARKLTAASQRVVERVLEQVLRELAVADELDEVPADAMLKFAEQCLDGARRVVPGHGWVPGKPQARGD